MDFEMRFVLPRQRLKFTTEEKGRENEADVGKKCQLLSAMRQAEVIIKK